MRIYFVTSNPGKVHTVQEKLKQFDITVIHEPLELEEIQHESVEVIAQHKALQAFTITKQPTIVIDSEFRIAALNGFPGPYTSYVIKRVGPQALLNMVGQQDRACDFRNTLAYMDATLEEPKIFTSVIPATLSNEVKGTKQPYFWSDLFFIVIPEGETQTLAEMTPEYYEKYRLRLYKKSYLSDFGEWLISRTRT